MSEQEYWDWIVERKDNHGLLVVGTPCNNGGDDTQNELGLVNCHQYAIIDYVILPSGQKLYKVRNPWHSEKYFGPYSDLGIGSNALLDSDLLWLNENGYPHEKANDGEFWMRSEDFYSSAHVVTYNPDVAALGWYHDYHLVIDDDGTGSEPGIWWWCGEFCSRYTAVITNSSDKSNKIHVGLHTWRQRTYGSTSSSSSPCYQRNGNQHSFARVGASRAYGLHDGVRWEDEIYVLEPGQSATYTIEMNLAKPYMSRDWAFTAWGENGEVSVVVNGKGSSDHWPLIDRDDNLLPENEREIESS